MLSLNFLLGNIISGQYMFVTNCDNSDTYDSFVHTVASESLLIPTVLEHMSPE